MASNSIVDFRWQSSGGVLLDSSGDIAFTSSSIESLQSMVYTRLKSAVDGWKLYTIGAGLDQYVGEAADDELEISVQKQVTRVLTNQLLPTGSFSVSTITVGTMMTVYVFMNETLVASTSVAIS